MSGCLLTGKPFWYITINQPLISTQFFIPTGLVGKSSTACLVGV